MFALGAFAIGLFLLFKGSFRLASRTVSQRQARSIALILMAPLVFYFCAFTLLISNNPNSIQVSGDGSTFSISSDMLDTMGLFELISVGGAAILVFLNIYGTPKTDAAPTTRQQQAVTTPMRVPDIMTVAEAAAYMRVSESEVMALIDQGKLGAARIGDSYRIARIAIEDFMGRT